MGFQATWTGHAAEIHTIIFIINIKYISHRMENGDEKICRKF